MKVKLLFFFSFVLASAALVQHGVKLPLHVSNKVEGSENIELLLYHVFCGEKFFFMATFFVANSI